MYLKVDFPIISNMSKVEQRARVFKLKVFLHLDQFAINILKEDKKNIFNCGFKMLSSRMLKKSTLT